MALKKIFYSLVFFTTLTLVSCDKGYDVRLTNYYIETLDSVIIGDRQLVFTNILPETTTDFRHITRGQHSVVFYTKTKGKFYYSFFISSKGTGKRTIQVDAIRQINVFEE
jgi:hypothetical protein